MLDITYQVKEFEAGIRLERCRYYLNYYKMGDGGKAIHIVNTFDDIDVLPLTLYICNEADGSRGVVFDTDEDKMDNIISGWNDSVDVYFELDEDEYNLIVLAESI